MSVLISCAGDNEMAEKVHDLLVANVSGDISLVEDEIEVKSADKDMVRKSLDSYVSEARLEDYSITEFGDILSLASRRTLASSCCFHANTAGTKRRLTQICATTGCFT